MHLKIIVAILCLSLVLVQAGDYGRGNPKSTIMKNIQPSRVVVVHHHHGGKRGGSSSSSNSSKKSGSNSGKKGGSSGSGEKKKRRYRRSVEDFGSSESSLED